MAWLRVGQASWVFECLGVVIAVGAPGLLGHLPSISDLGVTLPLTVFKASFKIERESSVRIRNRIRIRNKHNCHG